MNLKAILAKEVSALTADEAAFVKENADSLTPEQTEQFASVVAETEVEGDEVIDTEALDALVSKSVQAKIDELSEQIAQKFAKGVATQRAKAFAGEKTVKDENKDVTKTFMKALFAGDTATLASFNKDVSGASSATGGYLIPVPLQEEVLRVAQKNYGLARRDFRYLPFSGPGNSRTIPALSGNVSVTWTGEGAAKSSTAPTFSLVTQTLKKLAAIVPMTDEILEDSAINLTQLISELFAEAVAKEEDLQFFNGTGSPWTGIVNNGSVNIVRSATTNASAATADDYLAMIDATPTGSLDGAKFYMHRTVMSALRKVKASGSGEYILQAATTGTPYNTLWGYPVELTDAMPTLASAATASKPFAMFGNLGVAAIFGDKQQLRVKVLDQATVLATDNSTGVNLAQQDMTAIRIVERVGYVLALPSAVTVLKTALS